MIKIKDLTKVYKSKKKNKCVALNNINLVLPDTGLVFILGKSGSGKSTLLNLIGGLDSVTSGEIIVNGNNLQTFSEKDFINYRSSTIGFIFQDYHLIEDLTVRENIAISLDLREEYNPSKIEEALKNVDLEEYGERFPSELSGGQKQRIAIARAIVKKPKIILADEPTGNLDGKMTQLVMNILKEISKQCLVIVVSHNVLDAHSYGDRIIEIENGQIIEDISKNEEFIDNVKIENEILYIPSQKVLSEDEICFINNNLKDKKFSSLSQVNDKFMITNDIDYNDNIQALDESNLSMKRIFKLCNSFMRSKIFRMAFSAFMIACIFVILAFCQTIIMFDSNNVLTDSINMYESGYILNKYNEDAYLKNVSILEMNDNDKKVFNNYDNLSYPIINYGIQIQKGNNSIVKGKKFSIIGNSIYLSQSSGTIIVDETFLINKYGINGKVEFLAGGYEGDKSGLIITDFMADSIKYHNLTYGFSGYDHLIGQFYRSKYKQGYINGIIKTDYKEKYSELIDEYLSSDMKYTDAINDKRFLDLINDIYYNYSFCYTTNKNFINDVNINKTCEVLYLSNVVVTSPFHDEMEINASEISGSLWANNASKELCNLNKGEIIMHYNTFSNIFDIDYRSTNTNFEPFTITLKTHRYGDINTLNPLHEKEYTVVGISDEIESNIVISDEDYNELYSDQYFEYGFYFINSNHVEDILYLAEQNGFDYISIYSEGLSTMTRAVEVFIPIFEFISIILCVGAVLILVNFSMKMIKDKMRDIGILKAIGCNDKSIIITFGTQILIVGLLTIILTFFGYLIFVDVANDILFESLKQLAKNRIVINLKFLKFNAIVMLINIISITLLSILSIAVPMVTIRKIKPAEIIKADD